jgi:hypothetical protein
MQHEEVYLDLVVENAEELATRMALAKNRFSKQRITVKLAHRQELESVRSHCTRFQHCVEEFEEAPGFQMEQNYAAAEIAWNESMDAVDALLRSLPW